MKEVDDLAVDDMAADGVSGSLAGKNALVTGASRGIGRAIAEGLARRGASVAVGYKSNVDLAGEVVRAIERAGAAAVALRADLGDERAAVEMFDAAERAHGPLDIVYANAADAIQKPMAECSAEDFERIMNNNVRSVFFTVREAARRVRDNGRIVITSTGGTRMFFTETALYLASKGAVEQFARVLSRELGHRNITVNSISPGFTETDLLPERDRQVAAAMSPLGRAGKPADVADVAVFLATEDARWITGQNIGAGGGVF